MIFRRKKPEELVGPRLPLDQFLADHDVEPQVEPVIGPDDPHLDGDGDSRYALGRELGRGGFSRVLLGLDRSLRRTVAIKVLPRESWEDPENIRGFLEEAIITGGLEHPNIVPAYELGYSEPLGVYFTMKRVSGWTLRTVIEGLRQGWSEVESFRLFKLLGCFVEICRAIAHAHSCGVIHTDLKPGNVLIGARGEVMVMDWGLAQLMGPRGARQARAGLEQGGTSYYMSPEQLGGPSTALDGRADVWALGVILYELLTLTRPFQGETHEQIEAAILKQPLELPSARAPNRPVPPRIEELCVWALEKDRERRCPSVVELLERINEEMEGTRERLRREEQARTAVRKARESLKGRAALERRIDAALSTLRDRQAASRLSKQETDHLMQELETDRRALLAVYSASESALSKGFEAKASDPVPLEDIGADLYWRAFTRIYPSYVRCSDPLRLETHALLDRIQKRAFAAVIRTGRKAVLDDRSLPNGVAPGGAPTDPWLSLVVAIVNRELGLDLGGAPSVMAELVSRIRSLTRVPLFAGMQPVELISIAEACRELSFRSGEVIFEEEKPGLALYLVLEGAVEVVRLGQVINTVGPGEILGELSVLGSAPTSATVRCVAPVRCLALEAEKFRGAVREQGEIGLAVIQVLADRLRAATTREAALRAQSVV